MPLASDAVYTILHPEHLDEIAKSTQPTRLHESKRWVTAKALFDEARARGEEMAILFADAANDCSKLIYWGKLASMEVDETGTSYTMTDLRPLRDRRTQELVLKSTGNRIAEGYLRPYAVIRTPSFIDQRASTPGEPVTREVEAAPQASRAALPPLPRRLPLLGLPPLRPHHRHLVQRAQESPFFPSDIGVPEARPQRWSKP